MVNFLDKQINDAIGNFNYFFMKMITKILINIIILSCVLLINGIFNILVINIITIIYTMYAVFNMYKIVDNYTYIMNDIKKTFNNVDFSLILDTNIIRNNLLDLVVKYGK